MNTELEEWKKHLQEIFDDVSAIIENRYVFKRLSELLQPNLAITNNIFFDHYVVNYASAILSSVRRQIDKNTSRGGLKILLENIANKPEAISKEFYLNPFGVALANEGNRLWSEKYGGKEFLDPGVVRNDIDSLEKATERAKDVVDKKIAHKDKDAHLYSINYKELDDVIDILEKITIKYYTLIVSTGSHIPALLSIDVDGWEKILKEAWVK